MSRTDGRKLVAMAFTATVAALGVGTIYLPFMADRDKLRGLFEEGEESIPEGARREIQAIVKKEREAAQLVALQQQQQQGVQGVHGQGQEQEDVPIQQQKKASAGSMWSSFRKN